MRRCATATVTLRLLAALALICAVVGCGGGSPADRRPPSTPPAATTPVSPAAPTTPPVGTARYTRALERYCARTTRALQRLGRSIPSRRDPAAPIAELAATFRVGVERLGRLTPPVRVRAEHLLIVAQGREAADRLDTGAQLARSGDADAATAALFDLQDLLPQLPAALRRAAPACA